MTTEYGKKWIQFKKGNRNMQSFYGLTLRVFGQTITARYSKQEDYPENLSKGRFEFRVNASLHSFGIESITQQQEYLNSLEPVPTPRYEPKLVLPDVPVDEQLTHIREALISGIDTLEQKDLARLAVEAFDQLNRLRPQATGTPLFRDTLTLVSEAFELTGTNVR